MNITKKQAYEALERTMAEHRWYSSVLKRTFRASFRFYLRGGTLTLAKMSKLYQDVKKIKCICPKVKKSILVQSNCPIHYSMTRLGGVR